MTKKTQESNALDLGKKALKNPMHEKFCHAVVNPEVSTGAQAAKVAGSKAISMSTLSAVASRLKKIPEVRARIAYLKKDQYLSAEIDSSEIRDFIDEYLLEGIEVGVFDFIEAYEDDNGETKLRLKSLGTFNQALGKYIASLRVSSKGDVTITMPNRMDMLRLLAEAHRYTDESRKDSETIEMRPIVLQEIDKSNLQDGAVERGSTIPVTFRKKIAQA